VGKNARHCGMRREEVFNIPLTDEQQRCRDFFRATRRAAALFAEGFVSPLPPIYEDRGLHSCLPLPKNPWRPTPHFMMHRLLEHFLVN
jgi:hypothetical protein